MINSHVIISLIFPSVINTHCNKLIIKCNETSDSFIHSLSFALLHKTIMLLSLLHNKHSKNTKHIIWLATTWSLWRTRNNIIFRGDPVNVSSLVDQIIHISWFWFLNRVGLKFNVVFSDWCIDPLSCLQKHWLFPLLNCKGWLPLVLLIIQFCLSKKKCYFHSFSFSRTYNNNSETIE
jgi:hypothetical protein